MFGCNSSMENLRIRWVYTLRGSYGILDRTTRTFVLQSRDIVERINSDRVVRTNAPDTLKRWDALQYTPEDLSANKL